MSENHNPKISIIIPVWNREKLVKETLDSILAQTFQDWECLVIDDQSTDNTYEVIKEYAARDSRIKVFQRPNNRPKSHPTCRNIGYENSTGELVQTFDSDDLLAPQFFETVVRLMDENSDAEYVLCPNTTFADSLNNYFSSYSLPPNTSKASLLEQVLSFTLSINTPAPVWRRSLLERCEMLWREGLKKGVDFDFNVRTMIVAKRGIWLDMPVMIFVRLHNGQMNQKINRNTECEYHKLGIDIYIKLYDYLCQHTEDIHLRECLLKGIYKGTLWLSFLYGDKEASGIAYQFFREKNYSFRQGKQMQRKVWLIWKLTPLLGIIGKIIKKFRKTSTVARLRKFFYRI
jgi:glycosyltransferase involved in cell wall biosynthesis